MHPWLKKLFPEKLDKELPMITITVKTEQLDRAMGDLVDQVKTMKQDRAEMSEMLDEVLKKVGRKDRS